MPKESVNGTGRCAMGRERPRRMRIPDFSGKMRTLSQDWASWISIHEGTSHRIVLGLGGHSIEHLPPSFSEQEVYFLEAPHIWAQTRTNCTLPRLWREISENELEALFPESQVWFYSLNLLLAPDYWGPLIGRLWARMWPCSPKKSEPTVLLWGSEQMLLYQELVGAFQALGYRSVRPLATASHQGEEEELEKLCQGNLPRLALSINANGLEGTSSLPYLLRALGVPLCIWFVDNPWHVLSAVRIPWWKDAVLFVTDPSFLPSLKKMGARKVFYLPLAAAPHMWRKLPWEDGEKENPFFAKSAPLFVGRSAFPEKKRFFAAAKVPWEYMVQAREMLESDAASSDMPHIHWWYEKCAPRLWPDYEARAAGLGAEMCSQEKRVRWLREADHHGFEIVGDADWKRLVPGCTLHRPCDYYSELPDLYYRAQCVLNVTSLQLPESLSQRHFDVWAAGGFLFSDPTKGLSLFPEELTRPMIVDHPWDLAKKLKELRSKELFYDVRMAWRACLRQEHSYAVRMKTLLSLL